MEEALLEVLLEVLLAALAFADLKKAIFIKLNLLNYLSKEALITQSLLFDSMRIVNFDWIRLLQLTSRGKGTIF